MVERRTNNMAPATQEDIIWWMAKIDTRLESMETTVETLNTAVSAVTTTEAERKGMLRAAAFLWGILGSSAIFAINAAKDLFIAQHS